MTGIFDQLFELPAGAMAVMVGGGGKTSLINQWAREAAAAGKKTVIGPTTKIFPPAHLACQLLLRDDLTDFSCPIREAFKKSPIAVLGREINTAGKIVGLDPGIMDRIKEKSLADLILVEGDGAKGKPFKAPRPYEPVIPEGADLVVPVVGVDAFGYPLSEKHFHCVEQICAITGLREGDLVQEKDIAQVFLDPRGFKKNVPSGARWIPFINKVESEQDRQRARVLAGILKEAGVEKVVMGAVGRSEPMMEAI
ncbi:selenium cofactor biosynthesis protein YqeC [Candidatus Formimonas warabiya]|uniref:Selenium-dependent hydroxylase accessory protein YqeC n=1 Tax=Formimonas warabiya TaxID=1761012 RepID=A0A3G1KQZ5_FORW1|nr:selenium cofactor biosynthesis protein YqeC [Candidatus Formimonas warabiya]ATW24893.1 hypothetical protein DCMF_09030 [Candidatus Formimonas warabiya]